MPTSNLRFGAFDAKKKREIEDEDRAVANPWPNPTPEVAPGSVKISQPIFTGLGGVRQQAEEPVSDSIPGVIDESPVTEMDALKSRFGLGSRAIDVEGDKAAVRNILANPTDVSGQFIDRIPEGSGKYRTSVTGNYAGGTGGRIGGEDAYLSVMARDSQNRAIDDYNQAVVGQQKSEDMRREEAIKNALAQESANNAMEAKRQEAQRLQEFFEATGLPPSPQASAAFSIERGRQTAVSNFARIIKDLIIEKEDKYEKLMAPYKGIPDEEIPPAIKRAQQQLDQNYRDLEDKMLLAAGLQSGTNNPGNMISKDQVQQLVP